MEQKRYKVVIAHPAKQHSFKTAVGLKSSNHLFKYITTVYVKKNSISSFCRKFLKGNFLKKMNAHKCNELEDSDVLQFYELLALFVLILRRVDSKKILVDKLNNLVTYLFNYKVIKYVIKNDVDVLVMYDTLAYSSFKRLEKKSSKTIKVLDMSAPDLSYMTKIFNENNNKYLVSKKLISKTKYEVLTADVILSASNFTSNSLLNTKRDLNNVYKIPYGIDSKNYLSINKTDKSDGKIKCIFLGNVTFQKGVEFLYEAIKVLSSKDFEFIFVGKFNKDDIKEMDYLENCKFYGHIPKARVQEFLKESDLMVFPSLADGFGFSVLEGLAAGVPVICSESAGVSDLISNGVNGFKIKASDTNDIVNKLKWFKNNKSSILELSDNARASVKEYSWERYYNSIIDCIEKEMDKRFTSEE